MNPASLPFVQTGIWVLAVAITIVILLVMFGLYIYQRKRMKALIKDSEDVAHLAAQRDLLQAQKDELVQWMQDQKVELERLTVEREEQEKIRAELNRLEQECTEKDKNNQALRNEVGELENQRYNLSQTLEKLEREIGDLDSKRAEAKTIEAHLAELKTKVDEAREAVRGLGEIQAKLEALSAGKASLERAVADLRIESDSAQVELKEYRQQTAKARTEKEEAKGALADDRKEKAELGIILDTQRQEQTALSRDIERMEEQIDNLKTSLQTAKEDSENNIQIANSARADVKEAKGELEGVIKEKHHLGLEIGELNSRKIVLKQELVRLEGTFGTRPGEDQDPLIPYADLLKKVPSCLSEDSFKEEREAKDETEVLQQLQYSLRQEGLFFSPRVIDAFHTSLKCHAINPLTVLAGVSGTGKTLLPMRYAEIMGMHRLVISVQPRWDSPQDMFGFYNYLEKEYKATELSRSLLRMDPYNYKSQEFSELDSDWAKKRLLLVLLDEMNLARTEYYFSEFLSKLELRREVKDESVPHRRSQAEIELDTGPSEYRFRLWVGHNVFFVGTMNEDETTQTLSDKVLDRANVIRFGKPDEKAESAEETMHEQTNSQGYLSFNKWRSWQQDFKKNEDWYEKMVNWTRRLNMALDRVGRPFGFRVQQAIGHYVANYPRVDDEDRYKFALADQIEQKIIPKLRGIDLGGENANECLSDVEAIIAELDDNELNDAFAAARTESENLGMFQWRGVTRRIGEGNL